jgi:hypothetical protein
MVRFKNSAGDKIIPKFAICHQKIAFSFEMAIEKHKLPKLHNETARQKRTQAFLILLWGVFKEIRMPITRVKNKVAIEDIENKFSFIL